MSVVSTGLPLAQGKIGEVGNAASLPSRWASQGRERPTEPCLQRSLGPAGDALNSPNQHSRGQPQSSQVFCLITLNHSSIQDRGHHFSKLFLLRLEVSV